MRQVLWAQIIRVVSLCVFIATTLTGGALAASSNSQFIKYPGFINPDAAIEVIHDKGLVSELIVSCGDGRSGILTASRIERIVCGPDYRCTKSLKEAVARICR